MRVRKVPGFTQRQVLAIRAALDARQEMEDHREECEDWEGCGEATVLHNEATAAERAMYEACGVELGGE